MTRQEEIDAILAEECPALMGDDDECEEVVEYCDGCSMPINMCWCSDLDADTYCRRCFKSTELCNGECKSSRSGV